MGPKKLHPHMKNLEIILESLELVPLPRYRCRHRCGRHNLISMG